mmetsp:Transcript_3187/g.7387  ORF Transcript_3187/g.7387 Transcript_3187/m.7387 type:complete len:502 (+) Transcript_3187:132-1637(+)
MGLGEDRSGRAAPAAAAGLVQRLRQHSGSGGGNGGKIFKPPPSPPAATASASDDGDSSAEASRSSIDCLLSEPGSFAYRLQENDSASSLGSLADTVAQFVVPERVKEKIPHLATGAMFWACTMVLWYQLMGLFILPFFCYFVLLVNPAFNPRSKGGAHGAQVGIVVMIYAFLMSVLLVYPTYFLFFANRWVRGAFLGYITWYTFIDRKAPESGVRFLPWTRRLPFWNTLADYFPVRLHKACELDPAGNYLFGYHPHGIIGVGAFISFATNATGFEQAFPGLDLRLLTLSINFAFPFTREVLMALGINSVTKKSVVRNLTRAPGASVAIVVGGAAEALDARPGWAVLTLARRKGFVKLALKTGASLVPVFAFGENDIFDQVDNPDGGQLRKFQLWMKQLIGVTPPAFYGRSLSGGLFRRMFRSNAGVMPKRESIEVVVGHPIPCPLTAEPTQAQIDEYHLIYITALKELYELHRRLFHKLRREGSHDDLVRRTAQMRSMQFQ